jgi:hypothetical protein
MTRLAVLFCMVLALAGTVLSGTRHRRQRVPRSNSLALAGERPDLAVDYGVTAKLKLVSRKTTYRVGEMISLDIAMLNTSDSPIYLHKLMHPSGFLTVTVAEPAVGKLSY